MGWRLHWWGYNKVTMHLYIDNYLWGSNRLWWITKMEKAWLLTDWETLGLNLPVLHPEAMARSKRFVDELVWKLKAFGAPKDTGHALSGFMLNLVLSLYNIIILLSDHQGTEVIGVVAMCQVLPATPSHHFSYGSFLAHLRWWSLQCSWCCGAKRIPSIALASAVARNLALIGV